MKTTIIKRTDNNYTEKVKEAAEGLKHGKTVVFPTETVYGLGANALDVDAVKKIFIAKGRPDDNPLIVHINDESQLYDLVEEVNETAKIISEKLWPGPITIILNKKKIVPDDVTAGLRTVAVRMPSNKVALDLISKAGVPVAAPSANISGKPSPTNYIHVIEDLDGRVDYILCDEDSEYGLESTVVDLTDGDAVILRPGAITKEDLESLGIKVSFDESLIKNSEKIIPKSPGMKYRHYAPNADLYIIEGEYGSVIDKINELKKECIEKDQKVGILTVDEHLNMYEGLVKSVGSRSNPNEIAKNLFKMLREFNEEDIDVILAEGFEDAGIGFAIMNRLRKAAGFKIIKA